MMLSFTKMNGAGNDFVMLDNRDGALSLNRNQIARLCDRHRGVGADGLLVVESAANDADFRMRYHNSDGGEAEMCGNGARCFARFASRISKSENDTVSFETPAGVITATLLKDDRVRLAMGDPHSLCHGFELRVDDESFDVSSLNTGVPHAVIFVDAAERLDIRRLGAAIRNHTHFSPAGTNVNFATAAENGGIRIRTYERGVEDETLACGTGVCAAALVHHLRTDAPSPVHVRVQGGDTLEVGFERAGETFRNVTLTGPADFVFEGSIRL